MKNIVLLLSLFFASMLTFGQQKITYRGIYVDDINGKEGLYNPDRGFRLETAVDVKDKRDVWRPQKFISINSYLEHEAENYASDSISLVQSYFYLTDLVGKDLTAEDIWVLQTYFNKLEELGMKSVLRFAYEKDFLGRAGVGPTLDDILTHLDQLKPFLDKNKHLISVFQAGLIGAWGEWHGSVHGLENSDESKKAILKKLLEVVPENVQVQIRVPEYKNLLKDDPQLYSRLSFHDDFIVIKPEKWDGDMHEGTANFDQIVRESPYLFIDGELPWGTWSVGDDPDAPLSGWLIDGHEVARRLFLQHYTSLSAIHNYKENKNDIEGEIPKYSMMHWKDTPLSESFLKKNKMPVSANYFEKQDGTKVERNVFDYIRDHLGYRVELQDLTISDGKMSRNRNLSLNLINRGFSTLFNRPDVYFVLIDETGHVTEIKTDANTYTWQPYNLDDINCTPIIHNITKDIKVPDGKYKLGLWIPDGSEELKYNYRYATRCANGNIEWWISKDKRYGINILTDINL